MLALGIGFTVLLGILVWAVFFRREVTISNMKPYDEREACDTGKHEWKSVLMAKLDELPPEIMAKGLDAIREHAKSLEKVPTSVCFKCGFISGTEKMLVKDQLDLLVAQQASIASAKARRAAVDSLEAQYFQAEVESKGLSGKSEGGLRVGYDLHRKFVDQLPELLKQWELQEILKKLRSPDDTRKP